MRASLGAGTQSPGVCGRCGELPDPRPGPHRDTSSTASRTPARRRSTSRRGQESRLWLPGDGPGLAEILRGRGEKTPCRSVVSDRARVPVSRHAAAAVTRCRDSCRVRTEPVSLGVPGRHAVCTFPSRPEMWKPWVLGQDPTEKATAPPSGKGGWVLGGFTPLLKSLRNTAHRAPPWHPPAFCLPSLTPAPLALAKFSYS